MTFKLPLGGKLYAAVKHSNDDFNWTVLCSTSPEGARKTTRWIVWYYNTQTEHDSAHQGSYFEHKDERTNATDAMKEFLRRARLYTNTAREALDYDKWI